MLPSVSLAVPPQHFAVRCPCAPTLALNIVGQPLMSPFFWCSSHIMQNSHDKCLPFTYFVCSSKLSACCCYVLWLLSTQVRLSSTVRGSFYYDLLNFQKAQLNLKRPVIMLCYVQGFLARGCKHRVKYF